MVGTRYFLISLVILGSLAVESLGVPGDECQVAAADRLRCAPEGITRDQCLNLNCCFEDSNPNLYACYKKKSQVSVEFSSSSYSFPEDAGTGTVDILRKGDLTGSTLIMVFPTDGTAKNLEDFRAEMGSISFPPGSDKQSYSFDIINNDVEAPDKSFTLLLYAQGVAVKAPQTTVTIANDEEWIPTNDYCSPNDDGTDYTGSIAKSISGKACITWGDLKDDRPFIRDINFKDGSISAAGNKCRNPETTMMPYGTWCYVRQGSKAIAEYCGVMRCNTLQEHLRVCRDAQKCSTLKQCAQNPTCGVLSIDPKQLKVVVTVGLDLSASTNSLIQQINFAKAFWEWAASDGVFRACFLDVSFYGFTTTGAETPHFHIYYQDYPEAGAVKLARGYSFMEFIQSLETKGPGGLTDLRVVGDAARSNPSKEKSATVLNAVFIVSDYIQSVGGTNNLGSIIQDLRNDYINIVPVLMDKVWDPDSFNQFFAAKSAEIRMNAYGTSKDNLKRAIGDVMKAMVNAKRQVAST